MRNNAGYGTWGLILLSVLILVACSFDYGDREGSDKDQPDIIMEDVDYTRVRSGDPIARLIAKQVHRFEERRIMELYSFSFEQYEKKGTEVNAFGSVGSAEFMIDSGDIRMDDGVRIEIETEDITIETKQLEWNDKDHILSGNDFEPTYILRANGTSFSGHGFLANARERSWAFSSSVSGTYIHDDDEDDDEVSEDQAPAAGGQGAAAGEQAPAAGGQGATAGAQGAAAVQSGALSETAATTAGVLGL